jgi:hypothetical protein
MILNTIFQVLLIFFFALTFLLLIVTNQIGQLLVSIGFAVYTYYFYKNPFEKLKK